MIVLALGSNKPYCGLKQLEVLRTAVRFMADYSVYPVFLSRFFETQALNSAQPNYVNAAVVVQTHLSPWRLLEATQCLEQRLGREGKNTGESRTLDVDIISYNALILTTQRLTLPHALVGERIFVLAPLRQIAPNWRHAVDGKGVDRLIGELPFAQKKNIIQVI